MDQELLHKIDKQLAVLEAVNKSHAETSERQLKELQKEVVHIRKDMDNLKVKVAGISSIIAAAITFVTHYIIRS